MANFDRKLMQSLLRLAREISLFDAQRSLQRRSFVSVTRRAKILSLLFDDLLRDPPALLPPSADLAFREILVVLRRLKALLGDCSTRSRTRLLLQAEAVADEFRELALDLSSLIGMIPLGDIKLSDDVRDLVDLVRRQCLRSSPAVHRAEERLRCEILDLIEEVERGIVPERSRLQAIFEKLGLDDSKSCKEEIESLEREIGDRVADNWVTAMVALVGLFRYAKCVLYGASTPRSESKNDAWKLSSSATTTDPSIPPDFLCPISLDLMRDPVVVASGQTYDRQSITRWIESGRATCPKTGQQLAHKNLIPNRALRNLIAGFCQEQNLPFDDNSNSKEDSRDPTVAGGNKAALEAARMTASFLVEKLAAPPSTDAAANRVVHELRMLAKTGSENRAFIAEAGAVPLLLPLLASDDADLQVNAVTALLNLSLLSANKKRIMHANGGTDAVIHVLSNGATWRAKENAAATVISLCTVHSYRRRLGRDPRVVVSLVDLATAGPDASKKDALAAILSLAGERENIPRLVEGGVVKAALEAIGSPDVADEAVAILAAVAKRGGAATVGEAEGSVVKLVGVLRRGSEWARESATAALVIVCRLDTSAVAMLAAMPGIESVVWELMASGNERARRKAASLGRICRRWVAAAEEAARFSSTGVVASTAMAEA